MRKKGSSWPLEGLETPSSKGNGKRILVSYTTLYHTLKNGKVVTTVVGNMNSNWIGYVLNTLD